MGYVDYYKNAISLLIISGAGNWGGNGGGFGQNGGGGWGGKIPSIDL